MATVPREVILPRTVVPDYLDETPLAVQDRNVGNFPVDLPHQEQAGDKPSFPRPSVKEQLQLMENNLADDQYFLMPWRKGEP